MLAVCIMCVSGIFGINIHLLLVGFCLTLENKEVPPNHSSVLLHVTIQVIPSTVARVFSRECTFHCPTSDLVRSDQFVCYYWFYTDVQFRAMGRCFFNNWLLFVCFSTGQKDFFQSEVSELLVYTKMSLF